MSRSGNVTVVSVTRTETPRAAAKADATPFAASASGDKVALIEVDDVGVRGPKGASGDKSLVETPPNPPADPKPGAMWWNASNGNTYIWYVDPSGPPGQWVQVNAGPASSEAGGMRSLLDWIDPSKHAAITAGTSTDDVTLEVQSAAASGEDIYVPAGRYKLTDMVVLPAGVVWAGADKSRSVFMVPNTFNLSAQGVFKFTFALHNPSTGGGESEKAPAFRHLGIDFAQPDTAVRANLVAYPPAIFAQHVPRFTVEDVRICRAMTGIDMRDNSGGSRILNCDISSFDYDIRIDGALDSVRISGCHFWFFGMTTNQNSIARDLVGRGISVGRCDGLYLANCAWFAKTIALELYVGAIPGLTGQSWGSAIGCDFDNRSGVIMTAGSWSFTGCRFGMVPGQTTTSWVKAVDGRINIIGSHFVAAASPSVPGIDLGGGSALWAVVQGCTFNGANHNFVKIGVGTNTRYTISGNVFDKTGAITYTTPGFINLHTPAGSRGTISGNAISEANGGTGNFINVASDAAVSINDNQFSNWNLGLPVTLPSTSIAVGDNTKVPGTGNGEVRGHMINRPLVARFNGPLVAGAATITHGIPNLHTRMIHIGAFYVSSGDRLPLVVGAVNATTLAVSGGVGVNAYEVYVSYTTL